MAINTIHPVHRSNDGLRISLKMSNWPLEQIPIPSDTTLWLYGDGPSRPYWRFFLLPDITVEKIVGIFKMPLTVEEIFTWYQAKMGHWTENHDYLKFPIQAYLRYRHPTEDIKLELDVRRFSDPNSSWVLLTYVTIQPWPNVTAET